MGMVVTLVKWLLALVVAGVLGAYLLPASRHVERSREIAVPPERLWPLIAEPRQWIGWQPWYARDPAMKLSYSGAESGTGAQWAWESASEGRGRMAFEHAEAPRLLHFRLEFVDMGSVATGQFRLEPVGAGTRVTWAFDTQLGLNPLMRWSGLVLDSMVGRDFEAGLDRMAALVTRPAP
jgi:uncharacterized protein YndB with AHSA1/START domain